MNKRIPKNQYYLNIAKEVAQRSTCLRRTIGAVVVRDDQIISTGYVGAPRKTRDSQERGFCIRSKINIPSGHRYELCRSVHAEQNAIADCAKRTVSCLDCIAYITHYPCIICARLLLAAGIGEIKYIADYKQVGLIFIAVFAGLVGAVSGAYSVDVSYSKIDFQSYFANLQSCQQRNRIRHF